VNHRIAGTEGGVAGSWGRRKPAARSAFPMETRISSLLDIRVRHRVRVLELCARITVARLDPLDPKSDFGSRQTGPSANRDA